VRIRFLAFIGDDLPLPAHMREHMSGISSHRDESFAKRWPAGGAVEVRPVAD